MNDWLKNSFLVLVSVLLSFMSFYGCASFEVSAVPYLYIRSSDYITGQYAIKDYAYGSVKITDVSSDPNHINFKLSNCLTASLVSDRAFRQGENSCVLVYRGFVWKKKFNITIHEICLDDIGQIMFVKLSADLSVNDCDKSILSMSMNRVHVQNSLAQGCKTAEKK